MCFIFAASPFSLLPFMSLWFSPRIWKGQHYLFRLLLFSLHGLPSIPRCRDVRINDAEWNHDCVGDVRVYASVHMIVSVLLEPRWFGFMVCCLWDKKGARNKSSKVRRAVLKSFPPISNCWSRERNMQKEWMFQTQGAPCRPVPFGD